jgi:hypothetical protein
VAANHTLELAQALAAAAMLGAGDQALARVRGPDAQAARGMVADWRRLPRATRASAIAAAAYAATAPVPAGIDGIHPSWIERRLQDEGAAAAQAWARRQQVLGPLEVWWLRRICAGLTALPPPTNERAHQIAQVVACSCDEVAAGSLGVGAALFAHAAGSEPDAGARVGTRFLPAAVWAQLVAVVQQEGQGGRMGSVRAALALFPSAPARDSLTRAGLAVLMAHAATHGPPLAQQLAQKLPVAIADELLAARRDLAALVTELPAAATTMVLFRMAAVLC